MIPIAKPWIGEEEIEAVTGVMRSGMLASGEEVSGFETEFAHFCGASHAIATSNGTTALHAGLLSCGVHSGDEVIVPSFTFIATATSVSMCGAKPVMVDIDEGSYGISPDAVTDSITDKTKAVIGVHLFGHPFHVREIQEICEDHQIILIEDCAQAHGSEYGGKKVGSFGTIGCFSFYPTKNMTTGEGGIITTNDDNRAEHIRRLINHGQAKKYLHSEIGYNYRMTNICAALGRVQLTKIDSFNKMRKKNAEYYNVHMNHELISTPVVCDECTHVYHQYVIRVKEKRRDELASYLLDSGIGNAIHYPIPVHEQPVYADMKNPACPVSSKVSQEVLSLPVYPGITEEELEYICETINQWS